MTQTFEDIDYAQTDGVATITLSRPERLNAWTGAMERSVKRAVLTAAEDPTIRAIVITGAGRGFCAGADMQALKGASEAGAGAPRSRDAVANRPSALEPELTTPYPGRFGYLLAIEKPIIAAISGPCAGIGLVLTLFCDLRFASDQAIFTTAFAQRGLIAEHGCSWLLPRIVGPARALDLLMSARRVSASEAAAIGLVNQTFAHASFTGDVQAYVKRLASDVSPRSLAVMKAQVWKSLSQSFEVALDVADREMSKSFASADFKEGVAHFVEKRPARFNGR